ncbi:MAG: rRNA maturation RNase YbeY [Spirochaetales bacterium]|nr:rRNA maturation RNase YbeY [Spirochaetales bacterium]
MNVVEIRVINVNSELPLESLKGFCLSVLEELGKNRWDVSVLLCDDAYMSELNGKFRGKYRPTDVLSFGQGAGFETEDYHVAGDIAISVETMKKNAAEQQVSETEEMRRLLVHGILHLAGMDHGEDAVDGEMLDLQERILRNYAGV